METKPTSWTITDSSTPAPIRVFNLTADDGTEAYYRVERLTDGRLFVRVTFNDASSTRLQKLYARAHAARFLAQVLDTIADFLSTGDEPLDVDDDVTLIGNRVELAGPGAVLASAAFFGAVADTLFNAFA